MSKSLSGAELTFILSNLTWSVVTPLAQIDNITDLDKHMKKHAFEYSIGDIETETANEASSVSGERPVLLFDESAPFYLVARLKSTDSVKPVPFSALFRVLFESLTVKVQLFLATNQPAPEILLNADKLTQEPTSTVIAGSAVPPRQTSLQRSDSASALLKTKLPVAPVFAAISAPKRSASFVGTSGNFQKLQTGNSKHHSLGRAASKRNSISNGGGDLSLSISSSQSKHSVDGASEYSSGLHPLATAAYFHGCVWEGANFTGGSDPDSDSEDYHSFDGASSVDLSLEEERLMLSKKALLDSVWLDDDLPFAVLPFQVPLDIPEVEEAEFFGSNGSPPEIVIKTKITQERFFNSVNITISDDKTCSVDVSNDAKTSGGVEMYSQAWCDQDIQSVGWLLQPLCSQKLENDNPEALDVLPGRSGFQASIPLAIKDDGRNALYSTSVLKACPVVQALKPRLYFPPQQSEIDYSIVGLELETFGFESVENYYNQLLALYNLKNCKLVPKLASFIAKLPATLSQSSFMSLDDINLELSNATVTSLFPSQQAIYPLKLSRGNKFSCLFKVVPYSDKSIS